MVARIDHGRRERPDSTLLQGAVLDSLVLALVVATSAATYVARLGFYSDDWSFLGRMGTVRDQSLLGLWRLLDEDPNLVGRPVQILQQALLNAAFGREPLGYHVVNTSVLAAAAAFLYLALRELGMPRYLSFAVPALFALLPTYSPDRFWFAAFGYAPPWPPMASACTPTCARCAREPLPRGGGCGRRQRSQH